jgi:hypothetical protein
VGKINASGGENGFEKWMNQRGFENSRMIVIHNLALASIKSFKSPVS